MKMENWRGRICRRSLFQTHTASRITLSNQAPFYPEALPAAGPNGRCDTSLARTRGRTASLTEMYAPSLSVGSAACHVPVWPFTGRGPRVASFNRIQNQEAHHKKMSFDAEFLTLLKKHNIPFDPKFALA